MTPILPTENPIPKPPKFPWFSKGIALLALLSWGFIWAYRKPNKPGEKPMDLPGLLLVLGFMLFLAVIWQWIRYRAHHESLANGTYGQPSFVSQLLKGLFSGPTVHTGRNGGQYIVDYKGNKHYKHRR
jgi:drug/metabolite transporter (DMT)-like permease